MTWNVLIHGQRGKHLIQTSWIGNSNHRDRLPRKPTSGAVAEPFGGGQILAQESHSRPPPIGVNGYFRERLPPRRDQRHPEDRKFTFGMRNSLHDSTSRCPLTALGNAICRVNGNKTQPVTRHVLDFIGFWKSACNISRLKQRHLECVRLGAYLRCKR